MEKTLAEKYMNKIWQLFDEQFVLDLLRRELLPLYPTFSEIKRVSIKPYKKMIWETTYHVVIRFKVYFSDAAGTETILPIVCTAHSDEARENVFQALNYLWAENFPNTEFEIPRPLFYSAYFQGTFYRALSGENLLYYIKNRDFSEVERIVEASARLFARLHQIKISPAANFNLLNSRIATVIPGTANIFREMKARYGNRYNPALEKIYAYFIEQEQKFLAGEGQETLIHGDAHPENIIATANKIGLIDFADMCVADPARDLGAFLQQLEYKINSKVGDEALAKELKIKFLETYLAESGLTLSPEFQARIDLYYNWTAIRTAIYWFLKFGHNEERAENLLTQVQTRLSL